MKETAPCERQDKRTACDMSQQLKLYFTKPFCLSAHFSVVTKTPEANLPQAMM